MAERLIHLRVGKAPDTSKYFLQMYMPDSDPSVFNNSFWFTLPDNIALEAQDAVQSMEESVKSIEDDDRSIRSSAFKKIAAVGRSLFTALRGAGVAGTSLPHILSFRSHSNEDLLILLQIEESAAELDTYLWEGLNYGDMLENKFIICRDKTALARYLPSRMSWIGVDSKSDQALNMLVVSSSFSLDRQGSTYFIDNNLEQFIKEERRVLDAVLDNLIKKGLINQVKSLDNPSAQELAEALKQDINILHYIGHGSSDESGGYIVLRQDSGQRRGNSNKGVRTDWKHLQPAFAAAANSLHLVMLNACQLDSLDRVAAGLVSLGIPAIVSMRRSIGAAIITRENGFTQTFYTQIVAGKPVHLAFSTALNSIWWPSPVETFIPTLTLGYMHDLVLLNPNSSKAQQMRKEVEVRNHPAEELAQSLRKAVIALLARPTKEDFEFLQSVLQELAAASSYLQEPILIAELEGSFNALQNGLRQVQSDRRWLEAQRMCRALQTIADLMPVERRPVAVTCDEIDGQVQKVLEAMEHEIEILHRYGALQETIKLAQQYLESDAQNARVRQWLEDAREEGEIDKLIVLNKEPFEVNEEILQQMATLTEQFLHSLTPEEREELNRWPLVAAQQLRNSVDLADMKKASPDQSDNATLHKQQEALYEEIQAFRRTGRWDEAEAKCQELVHLAPQSDKAWRLYCDVLLEYAKDAKRRYDLETLQKVSERILSDMHFKYAHTEAEQLRDYTKEALELLERVKLIQ